MRAWIAAQWHRFAVTPYRRVMLRVKAHRWHRHYLRLWSLRYHGIWKAARQAVEETCVQTSLQAAAAREEMTSYCPRCGQLPDGDRRMEEARERVIELLGYTPRRCDLDLALAWEYWRRK